ncbi:efflux RND transporter periplasmic adaptor subunit [Microcoleus sp. FACHB-68]|nr:efflux RND transporter periplasmic adaptor subunit [Microcoleus sp. FACHB-68]
MQLQSATDKESALKQDRQRPPEPPVDRSAKPKRKWMPKGKGWAIGLIAAALLGTGGTAFVALRNAAPKVDISELTVPVESKNLTVRIGASGAVQPVQRVNLSPKTQGRLAELYVEQGDRVEAGKVVARMESGEIEAQLMQAQARLSSAKARLQQRQTGSRPEEIVQAQARLNQAQASLDQLRAGSRSEDVAEAEAGVTRAQAQVEEAQSRLNLASSNVRRNRELADVGAIARKDLDQFLDEERRAQANLEQVRAGVAEANRRLEKLQNGTRPEEIEQAEAAVAEAQSSLEQLQNGTRPEEIAAANADVTEAEGQVRFYEVQLEDTKVRAPFAGIITQRYAIEGAFVTPATSASDASSATSTSIVALARDLEVLAKVPEADIGQIKVGQTVEIVADAYPDRVFKGRVHLIAPEAVKERDVTLFQARVSIDAGKDQLQSGMNVDIKFVGDKLSNALVVPTVAIVTNKGETGVLIPDEKNQPKFQSVTVGSTIGNQIQVLDGVKAGDRVFLELPEGKKLEDVIKTIK